MKCPFTQVAERSVAGRTVTYTHPCGYCLACRMRKRREWATRIMLESRCHRASVFVTLTYAQVPEDGSLVPDDVQLWMKRYRKRIGRKVRFFLCGEYGEKSGRPHYHAILFGVGVRENHGCHARGQPCPCVTCKEVRETWKHGHVQVDELTPQRAQYVARYTTKKWSNSSSPPDGAVDEFARMSRRPGLAHSYLPRLAEAIKSAHIELFSGERASDRRRVSFERVLEVDESVPWFVRMEGKTWLLDRYIREYLNRHFGGSSVHTDYKTRVLEFGLRERQLKDPAKLVFELSEHTVKLENRMARERRAQGVL